MSITRRELTDALNEKTSLGASECAQYVDDIFEVIAEALERGEKVKISGFGVFSVHSKHARRGRNPQTGEEMEIGARRVVTFKPSFVLREKMAEAITISIPNQDEANFS